MPARFGFVFSRRGIVPEACSSWFLPRIVGISQALEWCYSGRVFDAQEALRGGLVNEVVKPDELLPRAYALAGEIRDNTAPVSVALIRQMMWRLSALDHPMEAHKIDSRGIYSRGSLGRREGRRRRVPRKAPREIPAERSPPTCRPISRGGASDSTRSFSPARREGAGRSKAGED